MHYDVDVYGQIKQTNCKLFHKVWHMRMNSLMFIVVNICMFGNWLMA